MLVSYRTINIHYHFRTNFGNFSHSVVRPNWAELDEISQEKTQSIESSLAGQISWQYLTFFLDLNGSKSKIISSPWPDEKILALLHHLERNISWFKFKMWKIKIKISTDLQICQEHLKINNYSGIRAKIYWTFHHPNYLELFLIKSIQTKEP